MYQSNKWDNHKLACIRHLEAVRTTGASQHTSKSPRGVNEGAKRPRRRTPPGGILTPAPGRSEGTAHGKGGRRQSEGGEHSEPTSIEPPDRTVCGAVTGVPHGVFAPSSSGRHGLKAKTPTLGRRGCHRTERRARTKRSPKTNLGFSASGKKTV